MLFRNGENIELKTSQTMLREKRRLARKGLHQLAREGDVKKLEAQFETSEEELTQNINKLDEKNLSPLHYAAKHLHLDMVQFLISKGTT